MDIIQYNDSYHEDVISLILDIQKNEAKINLTLEEQPDLNMIRTSYIESGGNFWLAVDNDTLAGTIGLMKIDAEYAVLKKFFVRSDYRSQKVGLALYETLLEFAKSSGFRHIILDTPSVAVKSHLFYERAGFRRISGKELPVEYHYPDRNSILYKIDI